MTKEIKAYLLAVDAMLSRGLDDDKKSRFAPEMRTRIEFYQHERLIHLIVTALFAVLAVGSFIAAYIGSFRHLELIILTCLFVLLLIPYIAHYYFLENSVQKLYRVYFETFETKE